MHGQVINIFLNKSDIEEMAAHIEVHAPVFKSWIVDNVNGRDDISASGWSLTVTTVVVFACHKINLSSVAAVIVMPFFATSIPVLIEI